MKILNNFNEFNRINEGFNFNIWNKIKRFFKNKYKDGAWEYILKYLKGKNKLPKGVEYFPSSNKSTNIKENFRLTSKKGKRLFEDTENIKYVELRHADNNISNEEADEIEESLIDAYNYRLNQNDHTSLFIWGAPGIGKTEIVNHTAKKLGLDMIVFHLSQIDPTEFRGIPKIKKYGDNDSSERTVNILPSIFPTNNGSKDKGGILFLDELNRAPKIVLSAALPLVLDGKIGDYNIPSKWIVVAAGNRKEDIGFDATEIEPALSNRFQHINFVPTVEKWTLWANEKEYIDPKLVAFLNFKKEYFHKLKEDDSSMAWPSPRSWTKASKQVYNIDNNFNVDERRMKKIYTRNVGLEAAINFISYLELKKIFNENDIKDVYKKGSKAKKPPEKLDRANAVMSAIAFYKKGNKLTEEELENVLDYANSIDNFETKTTLISLIKLASMDKKGYSYIKEEEPWKSIRMKYLKLWHEAEKKI